MANINSSNGSKFFLIGFMGSGKTYWGKKWATANQLSFLDIDDLIEKNEGKTISEIFESRGEDHFRRLEAATLRNCADLQNTIIACGGGTPCFLDNMQWMNDHGITIYVAGTSMEILQRLLSEQEKRPLLKELNETELLLFIGQKLKEREPFYTQAKLTVQAGLLTENSFPGIISPIIS